MAEYCVEYAKSNRATCKGCGVKIEKVDLRIGTSVPGPGDYMLTSWKHLACQKKPSGLASIQDLAGLSSLNSSDTSKVQEWFDKKTDATPKRMAGPASQQATPKKAKTAAVASPSATPVHPSSASSPVDEAAQLEEAEQVFSCLPVHELKSCLRANEQLLSGNKGELMNRCVDRKVYGNLPKCPECGVGRLKVTYTTTAGHAGQGSFSCPGGYDDDEYKRCSYRTKSVVRPAWIVTDHEHSTSKSSKVAKSVSRVSPSSPAKSSASSAGPSTPARAQVQYRLPTEDE